MENITKEQADIIGEVANICTGTAATALSMIINRSTNITTPLVEVLDKENTLESDNHILVKVPYTSGLDGTNLMVLDVQDALVIASLMMGGDGRNLSNLQLDDLTLSAIAEAMNQMCGSIATSMASLLSRPTDIGFPLINSKDRKTFEIPDELCNGTDIVKGTFRLTVDAAFMRMMLKDILTKGGFEIAGEAADGVEAVAKYNELKPDLVTLDITMPNKDGIQALKEIKAADPNATCVMCSAMGQQSMVIEAIQSGAKDFIVKPFQADRVLESIRKVLG